MATGRSIHIGLDSVDPGHYGGWSGRLSACEFDAKDMAALAGARGFKTASMLTRDATAAAVTSSIEDAARELRSGDSLLVTYSGHGGQVPDTNADELDDQRDETWVLFDRQLVDDELYALWAKFRPGVRIVVLSDSCHSGSVTRAGLYQDSLLPALGATAAATKALPFDVEQRVYEAHADVYDAIQREHPPGDAADVQASVLLISGCQDNQLSSDGSRNGLFTATLLSVWDEGRFRGSYRRLWRQISLRMPPYQSPNLFFAGQADRKVARQAAFSI